MSKKNKLRLPLVMFCYVMSRYVMSRYVTSVPKHPEVRPQRDTERSRERTFHLSVKKKRRFSAEIAKTQIIFRLGMPDVTTGFVPLLPSGGGVSALAFWLVLPPSILNNRGANYEAVE